MARRRPTPNALSITARSTTVCAPVSETLPAGFQKFFRFGTLEDGSFQMPALGGNLSIPEVFA
jgi:hypothetical protein